MELHSTIACFIKDVDQFAKLTVEEKPSFSRAKIEKAQIEIYTPHTKSMNDTRLDLKQIFALK